MMEIVKEHKRCTLMNWSKKDVVEHCLCLEHNLNVLHEMFEQQYENCMRLIDDMSIINDTLEIVRKRAYEAKVVEIDHFKQEDKLCD